MQTPYWVTFLTGERILRATITVHDKKICKQHKAFLAKKMMEEVKPQWLEKQS